MSSEQNTNPTEVGTELTDIIATTDPTMTCNSTEIQDEWKAKGARLEEAYKQAQESGDRTTQRRTAHELFVWHDKDMRKWKKARKERLRKEKEEEMMCTCCCGCTCCGCTIL